MPDDILNSELFNSPDIFMFSLTGTDSTSRTPVAEFSILDRSDYSQLTFLDDRLVKKDTVYRLSLPRLFEAFRHTAPRAGSARFIFHSAFCCSTLLSRCLDIPGACLPLREPSILTQLAWQKRLISANDSASHKDWRIVLSIALSLLSRSYTHDEIAAIKPHNACNNIITDLLELDLNSRALFLYSDLKTFLISSLKSQSRRAWLHSQLQAFSMDSSTIGCLGEVNTNRLSDPEIASYIWLVTIYSYLKVAGVGHGDRIVSLNSDAFLDNPAATLESIRDYFQLAIPNASIRDIAGGMHFQKHAKSLGDNYDRELRNATNILIEQQLREEIEHGLNWANTVTRTYPVPDVLPNPLQI